MRINQRASRVSVVVSAVAMMLLPACGGGSAATPDAAPFVGDGKTPAVLDAAPEINPFGDGGSVIDAAPQGGTTDCGGTNVDTTTDPDNCGACGHSCQGQACSQGYCGQVALYTGTPGTNAPRMPAVAGSNIYWWDSASKYIARAPTSGAGSSVVVNVSGGLSSFATDGSHVYFGNSPLTNDYDMLAAPASGGSAGSIASSHTDANYVLVDGAHVFWVGDHWSLGGTSFDGTEVEETPLGGSSVTTLVSSDYCPLQIAIDSQNLYFTGTRDGCGNGSLTRATAVWKLPFGSGTPTLLANIQGNQRSLAVGGNYVYWEDDRGLMTVPIAGGSATTIDVSGGNAGYELVFGGIVADADHAYWSMLTPDMAMIRRYPAGGGAPLVLYASGTMTGGELALDGTYLYWADPFDSLVRAVGK